MFHIETVSFHFYASAGPRLTTGAASMFEDKDLEQDERVRDDLVFRGTVCSPTLLIGKMTVAGK